MIKIGPTWRSCTVAFGRQIDSRREIPRGSCLFPLTISLIRSTPLRLHHYYYHQLSLVLKRSKEPPSPNASSSHLLIRVKVVCCLYPCQSKSIEAGEFEFLVHQSLALRLRLLLLLPQLFCWASPTFKKRYTYDKLILYYKFSIKERMYKRVNQNRLTTISTTHKQQFSLHAI